MASAISPCIFCQIARSSNSTPPDDKVVAFQDIKPAAFRHYLVIPVEHIPTVNDLRRGNGQYTLNLVFISLHSIVLTISTSTVSFFPSYLEAEKLLEKIKPLSSIPP